jgi:hypothetical protein
MSPPEHAEDGLMLPPQDDRRWLLEQLTALVTARGAGPLVTAPLLEPTPRYFPDRWSGGEASVRRLVRRLCGYAGVEQLQVRVTIYEADPARRGEVVGKPAPRGHQELAVWIAGLSGGELRIGAEASALADPAAFVAAAARAVAHAWRLVYDLAATAGDPYDPRIDVTAVYLGFGLLTADAALRFTSRGPQGQVHSRRAPLRIGSLPPQGVCWLLAILAHARGLDRNERTRLARAMQANQAAFFRHAYAAIERMDPPVATQLGVPAREQWPAPASLAALTAPFPDEPDDAAPEARLDEDRGLAGLNAGKPVFMVDRSMAPRLGRVLFMGVLMLGGVVSRMSPDGGLGMGTISVAAVGLGLGGLLIGRLLRDRRCSEPKCGGPLRPGDRVCPRCGGTVAGTIAHPKERLAAEEALQRAQAADVPEDMSSGTPAGAPRPPG